MTERQIHDGLITFLRKERLCYVHHRMDKKSGIAEGWPDFTIVYCSRCLLLEIKTKSGKLSPVQKDVLAQLRANGTPTTLVYSVGEAVAAVQDMAGGCKAAGEAYSAKNEASVGIGDILSGRTRNLWIGSLYGTDYVFQGDYAPLAVQRRGCAKRVRRIFGIYHGDEKEMKTSKRIVEAGHGGACRQYFAKIGKVTFGCGWVTKWGRGLKWFLFPCHCGRNHFSQGFHIWRLRIGFRISGE